MRKIQLAVKEFALPVPRKGSIETHSGYGATPQLGAEIHLRVQSERRRSEPTYVAEKWTSSVLTRKPYQFVVSGRMDGFVEGAAPLIEEIKSAFDIEALENKLRANPDHPYWLQLRTYGYIHYRQTGQIPRLRLHLVSSRNFKTRDLESEFDLAGFESWLELRLDELVEQTRRREKLLKRRQKIATTMTFPFPSPRPGQTELISALEENFKERKPLLVQAPTGLGKTIGVLYPALKDALARGQKVIYVTPKNSQHQVALEAVRHLQAAGTPLRALVLTSKGKTCFQSEPLCNPEHCEFARDYYSKTQTPDLKTKLERLKSVTARKIEKLAREFEVCPFELSLETLEQVDVVICDYNYVFAPHSLIGRLSESLLTGEKPNLVIDEAHNLPARAQDYFSPSLSIAQLEIYQTQLVRVPDPFREQGLQWLQEAVTLIESYGQEGARKIDIRIDDFVGLQENFQQIFSSYLESENEILHQDPILGMNNLWSQFTESLAWTGDAFFRTYQPGQIKTTCCDASEPLKERYAEFANICAFSATLKPFTYYEELMGLPAETRTLEFRSPFPPAHRKLLAIPQISTKFRDRRENSAKIAEVMERIMPLKAGNYLAVFPSYDFLNLVKDSLSGSGYEVLSQPREMRPAQIEKLFETLREPGSRRLMLAVQGGVLTEGVDYPDNLLVGTFIVGPALPTFDFEREQVRLYYEKRYGREKAFDYAYTYPAMAKTVQAAGRVIRSEKDRGLIVLMDPRFLQPNYATTMPEGWFETSPQEMVSRRILEDVKSFWQRD